MGSNLIDILKVGGLFSEMVFVDDEVGSDPELWVLCFLRRIRILKSDWTSLYKGLPSPGSAVESAMVDRMCREVS